MRVVNDTNSVVDHCRGGPKCQQIVYFGHFALYYLVIDSNRVMIFLLVVSFDIEPNLALIALVMGPRIAVNDPVGAVGCQRYDIRPKFTYGWPLSRATQGMKPSSFTSTIALLMYMLVVAIKCCNE
jgi:hypothetical protein